MAHEPSRSATTVAETRASFPNATPTGWLPRTARRLPQTVTPPSPHGWREGGLLLDQPHRARSERLDRDYDQIEKTAQLRFDLGPNGERVEQTIEHLHELADLGIEVAHGALANVSKPGTLELLAERVIPAVADL